MISLLTWSNGTSSDDDDDDDDGDSPGDKVHWLKLVETETFCFYFEWSKSFRIF